jgi:PilZ domain-containing protein
MFRFELSNELMVCHEFMSEHRSTLRHRMLKAGKIEFGSSAIDCVVRNVSETGAALEVESPVGIPERFDLFVSQDRSRRPAHVVWRKARRIGIRFD